MDTTAGTIEAMYGRCYRPLVGLAISKFQISPEEASDIAHEAFLRLVAHQDSVRDPEAWLAVVVLNECRARRAERLRRELQTLPAPRPVDPAEALHHVILAQQAIRELGEREKQLLFWHFVEGYTARELAERTGLSVSYVAKLLHLSVRAARRACQVTGEEP